MQNGIIPLLKNVAGVLNAYEPEKPEVAASVKTCGTPLVFLSNMLESGSYDPGTMTISDETLKKLALVVLSATLIAAEGGVNMGQVMNYIHNQVDINDIMENMNLDDVDLSKFIPKE